ncbi:helix-turn-helix domain-containing protein [Streptomyces sp. NBC_00035]|uniref:helix-turn-helix domain-containing protein n=1 Tax=Streptomyces sp. NBC_00035 TaxID=2903614 RepID=UPI00324A095B
MSSHLPDDDEWLLQERQRIGRCIRDARMHRNLTQEQVFLAIPASRSFYQEIESGLGNPTLSMLLRIARILDVSIGELLS